MLRKSGFPEAWISFLNSSLRSSENRAKNTGSCRSRGTQDANGLILFSR
jgi:hypothetical protein